MSIRKKHRAPLRKLRVSHLLNNYSRVARKEGAEHLLSALNKAFNIFFSANFAIFALLYAPRKAIIASSFREQGR